MALRVTRRCSHASRTRSPAPAGVPHSLGLSPAAPDLLEVGNRIRLHTMVPGGEGQGRFDEVPARPRTGGGRLSARARGERVVDALLLPNAGLRSPLARRELAGQAGEFRP
jgi:hypothetical protein